MSTRRDFMIRSTVGGALLLGFRLPVAKASEVGRDFKPNAWIRIPVEGPVELTIGKTEMGQGVRTSLSAILAEELEVSLDQVRLVQASPGPDFRRLTTGGSTSVTTLYTPLRTAGAAARELLVAAAAANWGVPPESCRAESGRVHHGSRSLAYGELAPSAAKLPAPASPKLKQGKDFKLIGKSLARVDARAFATGQAKFGQDLAFQDTPVAVVARPPVVGGKPVAWSDEKAKAIPGVKAVISLPSGIAVLADRTDQALAGRDALAVRWDLGSHIRFETTEYLQELRRLLDSSEIATTRLEGDVASTLKTASKVLEAEYVFPFQSHASLEPPACVAQVAAGRCEIWCGTQNPGDAQTRVAAALGLKPEQVQVNVQLVGGGFGRRLSSEFAVEAALLAKAYGSRVKVVWTREDDFRHERYHPMSVHRMRGCLDTQGKAVAWNHRISAPSIALSWAEGQRTPRIPYAETAAAYDLPYAFPHLAVEYAEAACPLPLGWWRAIQCMPNTFARECFLDELAHEAGKDPVSFRLELLSPARTFVAANTRVDTGRQAKVLQLAAEKAGWGSPLPKNRGRGVALILEGNTYAALVAEVEVEKDRSWRVVKITAALDCGLVVNPRSAAGQVEGAVAWGLSALRTASTFQKGQIQQLNYGDFPVLPLAEMPQVESHFVPSQDHPTGLGEPPAPPVIPAVLNALFAATGRRIRTLPLGPKV